jgi:SAM-dependent methyltransferase
MAEFHFVEDYEEHVERLLKQHSRDEAMSLAVGGQFREIGEIEASILRHAGLREGTRLVDLGCGSGRLAHVLGESTRIEYLGIDIVQSLLDYAAEKSPPGYRFVLHRELSIPAEPGTADMVCAFSVFTHLLHEESYIYLESMANVLSPGGVVVFSFVEHSDSSMHWHLFEHAVAGRRGSARVPLNMFIERNTIRAWCQHLSFEVVDLIEGTHAPYGGPALGQSVAILRKC